MTFIAERHSNGATAWRDCDTISDFRVMGRGIYLPAQLIAGLDDGGERVIYEHPNGSDEPHVEVVRLNYMCRCILSAIQQDKAYIGPVQLQEFWSACQVDDPIPLAVYRAWPPVTDRPGMLEWRPAHWVRWDAVVEVQGIEQELRVRLVSRDSFVTLYRFSNDFKAELAVAWLMDHWDTFMPMRLQAEVCQNIEYNATAPAAQTPPRTESQAFRRLSIPEGAIDE